jgi:preprotein translocase subunit SecG
MVRFKVRLMVRSFMRRPVVQLAVRLMMGPMNWRVRRWYVNTTRAVVMTRLLVLMVLLHRRIIRGMGVTLVVGRMTTAMANERRHVMSSMAAAVSTPITVLMTVVMLMFMLVVPALTFRIGSHGKRRKERSE